MSGNVTGAEAAHPRAKQVLPEKDMDRGLPIKLKLVRHISYDSLRRLQQFLEDFSGQSLEQEGFADAVSLLSQSSINNSSPGFLGKLVSSPSPPGIASDLLLSLLNNNGHVWRASPALTLIEQHVSKFLAGLFNLEGPNAGGFTVPVARNILSPESKSQGVTPGRYAVFVSDAAHYSVSNAAQIVGLGQDAVVRIPTLENETMDMDFLEAAIETAIQRGRTPLFINATAGNTVNGMFDAIDRIGPIARKANAWYHIDACWGGAVAFSDNLRHLIKGSELADSIAFNPHKMLGVPLNCAFLLARDLRYFWVANKLSAGYLFHDDKSSALLHKAPSIFNIQDMASLTGQCSQRSDATKMFLHWVYYGTARIARNVERAVASAQHLAKLVHENKQLELLGDINKVFAQVCFYWTPTADIRVSISGARNPTVNTKNTHLLYKEITKEGWKIDYAPWKERGDCM
ncbi:hypothetical protein ASPBRDRAFT_669815 [Aspergillus brasiliensis CBS 101740]|uniref:Aminotransferase class V domain-containing protein n=1 Tax=Aspergillus brasiliensis (strain CBS 101740 / IMI 381727 / IBT 21946) TaxID=767769 RepID=A0A1L9U1Y3_ASPBC|nr:hypothetical protein ASPBRDRAFT_669815 [Aspergillus brasiliensis CBS 101740]